MPPHNMLKQQIRDGEVVVSLRVPIDIDRDALRIAVDKYPYNLVYLDGQHSPFTEPQLVEFCAFAEELGLPVQMRIPHTKCTHLIGRYLDFGLSAILVPEVLSRETMLEAVEYAYYPQFGRRSWGGDARFGLKAWDGRAPGRLEYAEWWNEHVVLAFQVESVAAVTLARQLAVPGVDYVAFGPNDLWFSLEGHPGFPLKTVDECMINVAEQLRGSGIRLGMAIMTAPEERQKYLDMGITVFQEAPRQE
ncbi:MAG: aldolase/citrate lyase family protein, partial [Caldilineaceae bacterium]